MRLFSALSDWWANVADISKIMILVAGGWATPRWFDIYEYLVWSLSDQTRMFFEGWTYVGFFAAIVVTVHNALGRARAEGRDDDLASRETRPLPKSN